LCPAFFGEAFKNFDKNKGNACFIGMFVSTKNTNFEEKLLKYEI